MLTKNDVELNTDLSFTLSDQLDILGIVLVSLNLLANNIVFYTRLTVHTLFRDNLANRDF